MVNELGSRTTRKAINAYHEALPRRRSRRLGMSQIGESCSRRIWYHFRWAKAEAFSGRMLRLFRRGQREENLVLEDLRAIGCVITNTGRDQLEIKLGPHIVGYPDGVIVSGVPEAPDTKHLLEVKTFNKKSFAKLSKEGIPKKHIAQMQGCMAGSGIHRTLYVGVCKDDDELHIERVKYDAQQGDAIRRRAQDIVDAAEAPMRIKDDPTWFECKICPFSAVCYQSEAADRNCRTCAHSTPIDEGWMCERWGKLIPDHILEVGCHSYVPHPAMHPGEIIEAGDTWAAFKMPDGPIVTYGDAEG